MPIPTPVRIPPPVQSCNDDSATITINLNFSDKGMAATKTKLEKKYNLIIQTAKGLKTKIIVTDFTANLMQNDPSSTEDPSEMIYMADATIGITVDTPANAEKLLKALRTNKIEGDLNISGGNFSNCIKS